VRGEWRDVRADVVAPGLVDVVIVRWEAPEEGEVVWVVDVEVVWVCVEEGWEEAFPCCRAECARKAATKLERKGRFVGIFAEVVGLIVMGVLS
jgi:hypothetical protein